MSVGGLGTVLNTIGQVGGIINTAQDIFGSKPKRPQTHYINLAGSSAVGQTELAEEQAGLAREQWNTYQRYFLPLEKEQAAEAQRDLGLFRTLKDAAVEEGLSGLRRRAPLESRLYSEALAGVEPDIQGVKNRAGADVAQSFDKVRDEAFSRQRSFGLQPARFAYLNRITDIEQAAAEASARTMAGRAERERADALSRSLLSGALSAANGIPNIPSSALSPVEADRIAAGAAGRALDLYSSAGKSYSAGVDDLSRVVALNQEFSNSIGGLSRSSFPSINFGNIGSLLNFP
jgi:hypothetical protein